MVWLPASGSAGTGHVFGPPPARLRAREMTSSETTVSS